VSRAETEALQANWLETGDGERGAWRIMTSTDPAFAIGVSLWVDGRPVRPGLRMRAKMAVDSLFGSRFAPMVVTVTPVVDWERLNGIERKEAEARLPAFLLRHRDLDRTVGMLSAR
jgi:hypothetical protein